MSDRVGQALPAGGQRQRCGHDISQRRNHPRRRSVAVLHGISLSIPVSGPFACNGRRKLGERSVPAADSGRCAALRVHRTAFRIVPFPLFQRQARWFARLLDGRFKLPPRARRQQAYTEEIAHLQAAGVPKRHYHLLGDRQIGYLSELARQCGDARYRTGSWRCGASTAPTQDDIRPTIGIEPCAIEGRPERLSRPTPRRSRGPPWKPRCRSFH